MEAHDPESFASDWGRPPAADSLFPNLDHLARCQRRTGPLHFATTALGQEPRHHHFVDVGCLPCDAMAQQLATAHWYAGLILSSHNPINFFRLWIFGGCLIYASVGALWFLSWSCDAIDEFVDRELQWTQWNIVTTV